MTRFVASRDGTRIAFDRIGSGPPVIVVAGLLCDRQTLRPLAERLAERFTVLNPDRRGRGESGDTPPYAVQREIEDLAALIAEAGGEASVYGHSSGAGLALEAAAAGLPIARLVLHEPPYGADDEESRREARELADSVRAAVDQGRPEEAIALFMAASGMTDEMIQPIRDDPRMRALARTMPYDFAVMGDVAGGGIPVDRVAAVRVPTLVLAGGSSPDFFREAADRIVELLPDGRVAVLEGHDHGAPAEVVAPVVAEFLVS